MTASTTESSTAPGKSHKGLKIMFMRLKGLNTSEEWNYVSDDDDEEGYVELMMTRKVLR